MMKLFRLKPIAPADPLIPILFGEWELDLQKKHISGRGMVDPVRMN